MMEFEMKEFMIRFLEGRIIVLEQQENVVRLTKEGAEECLEKLFELCEINDKTKAIIFHVKSLYIKKEVLRAFSETENHETMAGVGLISTSFIAKNVANILLKMRARFVEEDIPTEIFGTETEAIGWVRSIINA